MKVTDRDREAARVFVAEYRVRDIFGAKQAPELELEEMLATARAEGRREALEEAAKECEENVCGGTYAEEQASDEGSRECAARIRALAEKEGR